MSAAYAIDGSGLSADNGNYVFAQAAGNANALTVDPATLTYTATGASQTYGGTTPTLTGTVTGFVNGQTLADATTGTSTFTTPANAASNVGSYAIDGSGLSADNGNYVFAQAAGNANALTVDPATLTYTATGASQTYGVTPALTGTVSGFVNGQTLADATAGTLTFTTPATAASNVGPYAIDGSGLTADYGNYVFVQAAGNATALIVNPNPAPEPPVLTALPQPMPADGGDDMLLPVAGNGFGSLPSIISASDFAGVTVAPDGLLLSTGLPLVVGPEQGLLETGKGRHLTIHLPPSPAPVGLRGVF